MGGCTCRTSGSATWADGQPHVRQSGETTSRTARRSRLLDENAGQDQRVGVQACRVCVSSRGLPYIVRSQAPERPTDRSSCAEHRGSAFRWVCVVVFWFCCCCCLWSWVCRRC